MRSLTPAGPTTAASSGRTRAWSLIGAAAALWLLLSSAPGRAHLIDEIAVNILIDLHTEDGRDFALTYVLHDSQVEAYYRQAKAMGLAQERSDLDFAHRLAKAFRFDGCQAGPAEDGRVRVDFPRKGFTGFRLRLRCDAPQPTLQMTRVDYNRGKTRTTLYIAVRIGQRPARRVLVPPRLEAMGIPVAEDAGWAPPEKETPRKRGKGPASTLPEPPDPGLAGRLPSDPIDVSLLPSEGVEGLPRWRRALKPPPSDILLAWAEEGARHLALGPDHLLFLVAIALAAAGLTGLLGAVVAFSGGHMVSMALTLALDLPPSRLVEVLIAVSICWAGWRARRPAGLLRWATVMGAGLFGLVHGLGFGVGLKALVGGTDGIVWPIVSFGLGLDIAQTVWALALLAAWTPVRRALARTSPPSWATDLQIRAGWVLVAAGAGFAAFAALK